MIEISANVQFPGKLSGMFEPHRYKVMYGGRGGGKCLGLGTLVMMSDCSLKRVEDVVVGDLVMGPDGRGRRVLSVTKGVGELYEVRQTSGINYVVNGDHILSLRKSESSKKELREQANGRLRSPNGRYPSWPDVTNISIGEYLKQSDRWRSHFRGYKAEVFKFPQRVVGIAPYFLGIWLGDGTGRECRVTTADVEVKEYCRRYARSLGGEASFCGKYGNKAQDVGVVIKDGRVSPLWQQFKYYGLPNNKHIPQEYIYNSERVRLELLAGLCDSDGHKKNNGYNIIQKNKELAKGIKLLADTLGFRTSFSEKRAVCGNNGKESTVYNVYIGGDTWRIPCLIDRKRILREDVRKNKDWHLSMVDVVPIGVGEYAGFEVDGDHLFCLEDGTVTHNSWSVARYLLIEGAKRDLRVLCARELMKSIKESVHQLLKDQVVELGLEEVYEVLKSEIRSRINGTQFNFIGLRLNPQEIRSYEAVDIVWIEEAVSVSFDSWEVLIPTIRKEGSEIWLTFNPNLEADETYQRFVVNPPKDSWVCKINWRDNPWFSEVLRAEKDELKERDYQRYLHVWEGECDRVLTGCWFTKAIGKHKRAFQGHLGTLIERRGDLIFEHDGEGILEVWRYPVDDDRPWVDRYTIGSDIGEGLKQDYSVAYVFDRVRREFVARLRSNEMDSVTWAQQLFSLSRYYGNHHMGSSGESVPCLSLIVPERTGAGITTCKTLADMQANVYVHQESATTRGGTTNRVGFVETRQTKFDLLGGLREYMESSECRDVWCGILLSECGVFLHNKERGTLGAADGYHDDCVIAAGLAIHGDYWLDERPRQLTRPKTRNYYGGEYREEVSAWAV